MPLRKLPRPKCRLCRQRPRGLNPWLLCRDCFRAKRCEGCGLVDGYKRPGSFCRVCRAKLKQWKKDMEFFTGQRPTGDVLDYRLLVYRERASRGRELFSPIPYGVWLHLASPKEHHKGDGGFHRNGKGPRAP